MIIEPLKSEDVEKVAVACVEYAREIGESYDEDYILSMLSRYSDGCLPILVAKDKAGEVIGVSAFVCIPHLYNPAIMQARECIWHTSPKLNKVLRARIQLRLLSLMVETCAKMGISLHIGVNEGYEKILERAGFTKKNIMYVRETE